MQYNFTIFPTDFSWYVTLAINRDRIHFDTPKAYSTNGLFEENCDFRQRAAKLKLLMIKELANRGNTSETTTLRFAHGQIARLCTPLSKIKRSCSTDHSLSEIHRETRRLSVWEITSAPLEHSFACAILPRSR